MPRIHRRLTRCIGYNAIACFDQVVREALLEDRMVMVKSSSVDLVTQTDQKVEQLIIQSVKEKFPTHRLAPPPSGNSSQMRGGCFIMCVCVCVSGS